MFSNEFYCMAFFIRFQKIYHRLAFNFVDISQITLRKSILEVDDGFILANTNKYEYKVLLNFKLNLNRKNKIHVQKTPKYLLKIQKLLYIHSSSFISTPNTP